VRISIDFSTLDKLIFCVLDFENFVTNVINKAAFDKIKSFIDFAKSAPDAEIIAGGKCMYFVSSTLLCMDLCVR
jgi:acyl-CoA reductase-like NAD-dependent aldehyde dehydrogenase